jgi:hypothetical protein
MRSPYALESHTATGIKQSAKATLAQSQGVLPTSAPKKAFPATITRCPHDRSPQQPPLRDANPQDPQGFNLLLKRCDRSAVFDLPNDHDLSNRCRQHCDRIHVQSKARQREPQCPEVVIDKVSQAHGDNKPRRSFEAQHQGQALRRRLRLLQVNGTQQFAIQADAVLESLVLGHPMSLHFVQIKQDLSPLSLCAIAKFLPHSLFHSADFGGDIGLADTKNSRDLLVVVAIQVEQDKRLVEWSIAAMDS